MTKLLNIDILQAIMSEHEPIDKYNRSKTYLLKRLPHIGPEEPISLEKAAEIIENTILAKEVKVEFEKSIGMSTEEAEDEATIFLREHGFDATGEKID